MSAPQIPNLNSLRRRGGPGRFRSRGGGDDSHGPRGALSKDRVVQGTDNDASVSRFSAVRLGYLDDPYAQALTPPGLETRRLPIINRGTYVRTTAIDRLVSGFVESHPGQKKQIVSLGAGTDTRVFRLTTTKSQPPDVVYHEIDFPANTAAKVKAIRSSTVLQRGLGSNNDDVRISETGDALHSPGYHIHPLDLRELSRQAQSSLPSASSRAVAETIPSSNSSHLLQNVDSNLPTLLISECCLIYLSPQEADNVVQYFTKILFPSTPLGLIIYEPIRPDDPFGRTMVANLATRGIHLQTLDKYATLDAQRTRLRDQGFETGQAAADIDFIWERWVSEAEKERVAGLEMLDEMEEWRLLAGHYCISWGWRSNELGGDCWGDVEGQE